MIEEEILHLRGRESRNGFLTVEYSCGGYLVAILINKLVEQRFLIFNRLVYPLTDFHFLVCFAI